MKTCDESTVIRSCKTFYSHFNEQLLFKQIKASDSLCLLFIRFLLTFKEHNSSAIVIKNIRLLVQQVLF